MTSSKRGIVGVTKYPRDFPIFKPYFLRFLLVEAPTDNASIHEGLAWRTN